MTSPNTTTAMVEIMIARQLGTILSRKMGRASRESELESSRVESKRWWLLRIQRMGFATFRQQSLSEFSQICIQVLLIDMKPTVRPEHTPAKHASRKETKPLRQKSGEDGGMSGSSQPVLWKEQLTIMAASVSLSDLIQSNPDIIQYKLANSLKNQKVEDDPIQLGVAFEVDLKRDGGKDLLFVIILFMHLQATGCQKSNGNASCERHLQSDNGGNSEKREIDCTFEQEGQDSLIMVLTNDDYFQQNSAQNSKQSNENAQTLHTQPFQTVKQSQLSKQVYIDPPKNSKILKLSSQQLREYTQLDRTKVRESKVVSHVRMTNFHKSGKPLIFQPSRQPQPLHISVDKDSMLYRLWEDCCNYGSDEQMFQVTETY